MMVLVATGQFDHARDLLASMRDFCAVGGGVLRPHIELPVLLYVKVC